MALLVEIGLINALVAALLAVVAVVVTRYSKRPALIHALWLLVLIKLITPPLIRLPIPYWKPAPAPILEPQPELPSDTSSGDHVEVVAPSTPPVAALTPLPKFAEIEDLIPSKDGQPPAAMMDPAAQTKMTPPGRMSNSSSSPQKQPAPPTVAKPSSPPQPVQTAADSMPPTPAWSLPSSQTVLLFVGWIWISGAAVWYLFVAWRISQFRRLLRLAKPAPASLQSEADRLSKQIGLRQAPPIALIPGPIPPLLWSLGLRPQLYFPEALLPRLEEPSRSTLLVHELAHLARRDHWVRRLELVVYGLFWWYPLVWLACRRLHAAEEEACDALVVSTLPGYGAVYADALLQTVDFLSQQPSSLPPSASGFGRLHHLKRRLVIIVQGPPPRGLSWLGMLLVCLLTLGLPVTPTPVQAESPQEVEKPAQPTEKEKPKPVVPAPQPVRVVLPPREEPSRYAGQAKVIQAAGGDVLGVALSSDEKTFAAITGGKNVEESSVTIFDLSSGEEILSVLASHPLTSVVYSPDGKYLVTADEENHIQLRDPKTAAILRPLTGHSDHLTALTFSPDGKTLYSASADKTIKLWNLSTGKNTHTLTDHKAGVVSLAIDSKGKWLLSGSRDNTAILWDLTTRTVKHSLSHQGTVLTVAVSSDGKFLATADGNNVLKVWNTADGKLLHKLTGHTSLITAVTFCKDGRLVSCASDYTIRLWNASTGVETGFFATGHTNRIEGLAVTRDGSTVVTGSLDRNIKVFDVAEKTVTHTLQPRRYKAEMNYPLLSIAVSGDGKYFAVSGEERPIKLYDAGAGQLVRILDGHEDIVSQVAFSPDGRLLASAGFDGVIGLWDVATGKQVRTCKGHQNWVFSVAFSPDGTQLVSGGYDRSVRLWNVATGKELAKLNKHRGGVRTVAFSPDGKMVASAGADRNIHLWDVEKKAIIRTLIGHEEMVREFAFSPDSRRLVSCAEDMTLRLWEVSTAKMLTSRKFNSILRAVAFSPLGQHIAVADESRSWYLCDPKSLQNDFRSADNTNQGPFTDLAFSPDSSLVYVVSQDRTVRIWHGVAPARKPVVTIPSPGKQMWFGVYSPDGRWLATGGDDRLLEIRDAIQGRKLADFPDVKDAVFGLSVSPDGKRVAAACGDKSVRIYDLASRKLLATLGGHSDRVWMTAYSPDGKSLASAAGSWDNPDQPGEVLLWDLASGKQTGKIEGSASIQTVAWSPDGKTLGVGSRDGLARLYEVATLKERALLKGHPESVRYIRFDPLGQYVATSGTDNKVRLWTVSDGKECGAIEASASGVNCLEWSRDGTMLAATSRPSGGSPPGEVRIWTITRAGGMNPVCKEKVVLTGHTAPVLCCAFAPDGKTIASGGGVYGQRGEVIVWDLSTGKPRMVMPGFRRWIEAMVFTPDGSLITGGGDINFPGEMSLWKVTGAGWSKPGAGTASLCCAAWSPDSKLLAVGTYARTIQLWEAETGKLLTTLKGHKDHLRSLAFSPDGKSLASSSNDRTVKLWDVESRTEVFEVCKHDMQILSLSWSPDSKVLATASGDTRTGKPRGDVRLFDVTTGKEKPAGEYAGKGALSLAFSPDGKYLATGGVGKNALHIYDVASGKRIKQVNNANTIRVLTWSSDGKLLATAHGPGSTHGNGSIQLFDTTTWQERLALTDHGGMVLGLSFSPDGRYLASAANDKSVKVWNVERNTNEKSPDRTRKPK